MLTSRPPRLMGWTPTAPSSPSRAAQRREKAQQARRFSARVLPAPFWASIQKDLLPAKADFSSSERRKLYFAAVATSSVSAGTGMGR